MDKIEKIRQEIERLKGVCTAQIKANPGQTFPFVMEMTGYDKLLSFLDTLSEEPDKSLEKSVVDRELIKAAEFCYNYGTTSFPDKSLEEAAIDFADNAKKQLFAKDYAISSIADYDHGCIDGFKAGAKYETSKYTLIGTYNEDEYYIKKK